MIVAEIVIRIAAMAAMILLTVMDITIAIEAKIRKTSVICRLILYSSIVVSVVLCIIGCYYCLI